MNENDQARIKKLVRLRAPLKGRITSLKNYLKKSVDEIDKGELIERYEGLKGIRERFEEIQSEIETLVTDEEFEREQTERELFEEDLCAVSARVKAIINRDQITISSVQSINFENPSNHLSATQISSQSSSDNLNPGNTQVRLPNPVQFNVSEPSPPQSSNANASCYETNYRIPQAELPKFEGSYEQWPGFCDTFKAVVHNNSKFTNAEKLMYLRSCVKGKAAEKIECLETTSVNYQVAWSILERYYDDPAAVINNRIRAFFELPSCQNASATALGNLIDNSTKHYRALEALRKPFLEAFPIYLIVSKLDHQTRLKWKEETQGNSSPTMDELLEFLHNRRKILEVDNLVKNEKSNHRNSYQTADRKLNGLNANRHHSYVTQFKAFCHLCKGSHFTQYCERLVNVAVPERIKIVKRSNLCFNCLKSNHKLEECKSSSCKTCNKKHHSLLHLDNEKPTQLSPETSMQATHLNTFYSKNESYQEKLLTSAVAMIKDRSGLYHDCRFLLDSCSQPHILTERMASKLGLNKREINVPLGAINSLSSCIKYKTETTVKSCLNDFSLNLDFLIVNEVNEFLPSRPIQRADLKIPRDI